MHLSKITIGLLYLKSIFMKTKNLWLKKLAALCITVLFSLTSKALVTATVSSIFGSSNPVICQGGVITFSANPLGASFYGCRWNGGATIFGVSIIPTYNAPTGSLGQQTIYFEVWDNSNPSDYVQVAITYSVSAPIGSLPSVIPISATSCSYDSVKISLGSNTNLVNGNICNAGSFYGICNIVPLPGSFPATYPLNLATQTSPVCATQFDFIINSPAYSCIPKMAFPALVPTTLSSQSQVPSGNFSILQDITINGSISFTGKNIFIDKGVKITVVSSGVLNIKGSYLHTCACMWYGIVAKGNAMVITSQASIIEDAVYGITTDVNSTPIINISNTLFNKNNIAVNVLPNTNAINVNQFFLDNNIITCRNFASGFLNALKGNMALYTTVKNNFVNN